MGNLYISSSIRITNTYQHITRFWSWPPRLLKQVMAYKIPITQSTQGLKSGLNTTLRKEVSQRRRGSLPLVAVLNPAAALPLFLSFPCSHFSLRFLFFLSLLFFPFLSLIPFLSVLLLLYRTDHFFFPFNLSFPLN